MKKLNIRKPLLQKRKKIKEAERDYRKLLEEIKPFVKKRNIKQYSTIGKWEPWELSDCDL